MNEATSRLSSALAGRYRIQRAIGRGGMATVYAAEDVKHHRQVAIKVLDPELAASVGAERFLREIETTASLRHPHVLPLYDSGEAGGYLFYVMPFVEGESLRQRLEREKQLAVDDAIQIAREVGDALSYAHGRGVIHRDVKPENILLERGHAVVADFGIARAVRAAGGETLTQAGVSVGTPAYMSPEQAAGETDLDGRSDVYSLGCVLFEMLAGQPPFMGRTAESVVRQHLAIDPPPVGKIRSTVPAGVAAAVNRALAKVPADRFTAEELGRALAEPGPGIRRAGQRPGVGLRFARRAGVAVAVAAAAFGLVLLAVLGVRLLTRRSPPILELGRRLQVTREPGLELDPALSPDGRLLAYSGAAGILMVRQVEGTEPIHVVRDGDGRGRWPVWTPDGQRLVYIGPRGIEIVPALGGAPRLLAAGTDLDRGLTVGPAGRSFAYVTHDSLFAAPLVRGQGRLVTHGYEVHSPAWSADGRWIAFVSGNVQYISTADLGNLASSSVWVVPANGGAAVRVTGDQSVNVSPAWTPDGSLLYVSDREGSRDVYQVDLSGSGHPTGAPVRLTTGLNVLGIAMSLDGSRLAYSSFTETSNVWTLPVPTSATLSISRAQPLTVGDQTIENIGVSHDGRWLAFSSGVNGTEQLYRVGMDQPGAAPQQLTTDTAPSYWPDWSPDDQEIAFHRFLRERRQILVMSADGGQPVTVTDGSVDERSPEWGPDGRQLLLLASWATHPALRIVTRQANGKWSAPQPLPVVVDGDTIAPSGLSAWSPDGRLIACACGPGGLVIIPADGGPAHRLASPFSTAGWDFPQWSADGLTVFHVSEDSTGHVAAVVAVPVSGAPPWVAVRFDDPTRPWHRYGFRVRDGRFYFTLGDRQSDIWVADLRP
jgi:eukaryotic-like serine/threonine-protein kinase